MALGMRGYSAHTGAEASGGNEGAEGSAAPCRPTPVLSKCSRRLRAETESI